MFKISKKQEIGRNQNPNISYGKKEREQLCRTFFGTTRRMQIVWRRNVLVNWNERKGETLEVLPMLETKGWPKMVKFISAQLKRRREWQKWETFGDLKKFLLALPVTSVTLLAFPNFICHPPASSRKLILFLKITKTIKRVLALGSTPIQNINIILCIHL
jgi:hypothetical protein